MLDINKTYQKPDRIAHIIVAFWRKCMG